jgi:Cof subfamily protein (haloacid dehalogenase superfamily)
VCGRVVTELTAPRLIVLDIDGTLLTSAGKVLTSTRRAICELTARGHHLALASARPPRSVAALARDLLGTNAGRVISLNGALVSQGDLILLERCLSAAVAVEVVHAARERGLTISLFAGWHWRADRLTRELCDEAAILGFGPTLVADLAAQSESVHKLLALGPAAQTARFCEWLNAGGLGVTAATSKPGYAEITVSSASKAAGVACLASMLSIDRAAIIAFGDGENDIPMLRYAGIGVAMGNAPVPVQQSADQVTASNDHDGVAKSLAGLGLIGSPFCKGYRDA